MHRVHVPLASPPSVTLPTAEAHYLTRVLRLGVGAEVSVFDGRGHAWAGRIVSVTRAGVTVDLIEPMAAVAEPGVFVTLGIGLLKGDQMDAVVRDATMMGAAVVAPVLSAHVAVSGQARRAQSRERWERVAIASAKQCGRAVVPEIRSLARFEDVFAEERVDLKIVCVEPAHSVATGAALARPNRALLMIGPEGGWSPGELELARAAGARFLDLGPRTLRADAAPVVALSALWTEWGWRSH